MELLNINKDITEQTPLLVSACMSLKGLGVHPKKIDSLLYRDDFGGFSLDMILDVSNYASAIEFIGACKTQKYRSLGGDLAIALANFLLKRIAVSGGFIREGIDIRTACSELNEIFAKQQSETLHDFIRDMFLDLHKMQLLTVDNEAFLYLIVNFYLYVYKDSVLVYSDVSDNAQYRFSELTDWVLSWEG